MGTLLAATIPVGGNVYVVMMGGPGARVGAEIAALRMAYLSFRPKDVVQPQPIAAKLRAAGTTRGRCCGCARCSRSRRAAAVRSRRC